MTENAVIPAPDDITRQRMWAMLTSHWISPTVRVAADLSLAEHLADGGLTAAQVAERENSAPHTTFRLMRACVALGLLTADADGRFSATPLLQTLGKETPGSLRDLALGITMPVHWLAWNEILASVRTGRSQVRAALGMDFFDYLQQHPEQARIFTAGMANTTALLAVDAAQVIDTTNVEVAVDVGGATGSLLNLLQQANPALRGIVFDRPNIIAHTAELIARSDFADRTDAVGGDFFESVPPADLYLLKFILHDWDDQSCITILQRCREAMTPGARIAIIEMVLGELPDPGPGALMDMNMLAASVGQERSLDEYDALLAAAGLRRTVVRTTRSPQSVIEAVAA